MWDQMTGSLSNGQKGREFQNRQLRPQAFGRWQHGFVVLLFAVSPLASTSSQAQVCTDTGNGGHVTFISGSGEFDQSANCGQFHCYQAENDPPTAATLGGCDPENSSCTARATINVRFPGNEQGPSSFDSRIKLFWETAGGTLQGVCGSPFGKILVDDGVTNLDVGFTCSDCRTDPASCRYNLRIETCHGVGCALTKNIPVDLVALTGDCPPPPEETDCDDCQACFASGGGGPGQGAAPASGGGAAGGGLGTGPGVEFFYKAGGIGRQGQPGEGIWQHGRYWSHSYASRILAHATDPDIVYLVTNTAVFRTYEDTNSDDTYDEVTPASTYETLEKVVGGWTLTGLNGRVTAFNSSGFWQSTTDKNGNAKTATYSGSDLTSVSMPDGRREDFTYLNDKVATVAEVGVDGITSRTWTYTWSGDDLMRIDRPDGTALAYAYDDPSNPGYMTRTTLVGMDGMSERITVAFEYDAQGNVVKMWRGAAAFANGVDQWQYAFDNPALPTITTITDPLENTFTREFAPRAFATEKAKLIEVDGDCPACGIGPNSQLSYGDAANPFRATEETDGDGTITRFEYDANGMVTRRLEAFGTPLERETLWNYDSTYPALVTEIERPATAGPPDSRLTTMVYDALGDQTSRTIAGIEDGQSFSYTTAMVHNAGGQVTSIDPPGYGAADVTSMAYDVTRGNGHLIVESRTDPIIGTTTFDYDVWNRHTSSTDVNGVVSEAQYDLANRVTFQTQRGAIPAEDLITENRYNTFGDLFQTILPEGNVIEYFYDVAGRLETVERKPDDQAMSHGERVVYTLDDAGNRLLEEHERWDGMSWEKRTQTAYEFSTRCHLDKTIRGIGAEEVVTEYDYDCDGDLERMWDANHPSNGQVNDASMVYAYDALDRLITVEQPFGGAGGGTVTTTYGYDVQDHLTQVTDGEGTVTSYVYSDRGLLTKKTSEVSGVTTYAYNEHGEMTSTTDARSITETRTIDSLDRVTFVDYPTDSLEITYTYDDPLVPFSIGRMTGIERDGHAIDYAYDRFGRMTQDGDLGYEYDPNSNRTRIVYPDGMAAVYTHDYADRESTLMLEEPGEAPQPIITASSYEPSGPLASLTRGNGLTETRDYDSRYFPEAIVLNNGVDDFLDWQYTVDSVGNPTAIADGLDALNNRTYGYQDYQYFLTQGDGPWGTRAWTYDRIGNRLSETRGALPADTYVYVQNVAGNNSPQLDLINVVGGIRDFSYDAAGNQTQVSAGGNIINRTYDDAGRMSLQDRPAGEAFTSFLYDGRSFLREASGRAPAEPGAGIFCDGFESGDLSEWDSPGGGGTCLETYQTEPSYESAGVLLDSGAKLNQDTVFYFSGTAALQVGSDTEHLTADHLGTPILVSDAAGAVAWSGGFEPFGDDYSSAETFLRFPGQWSDESWSGSGLGSTVTYNVHRWYLPQSALYSRSDPLGVIDSDDFRSRDRRSSAGPRHLFSYANNNPLIGIDPLGLKVQICSRPVDLPLIGALGIPHKWVKTDTKEAGLGSEDGGVPGEMEPACDNSCPYIAKTAIVDHGKQSAEDNATCKTIEDVDEACVDRMLELGKPMGPWSLGTNDCWALTRDVIRKCRTRQRPPGPFMPPGPGIFPP